MCFAPQRCALFHRLNFQKCSGHGVFCTFWLRNVLLRQPSTVLFIWLVVSNIFIFYIYIHIWDNLSRWLIFFRGVETTNQVVFIMTSPFVGWKSSWLLEDDEATPHPNAVGVPRGWRGGRFGRLQWGNDNDDGYCQRIFFSDGYDKVMLVKYFDMTVIFSMIILMVPSLAIFKYELIRTLVWSHCCNDGRPLGFNNDWFF